MCRMRLWPRVFCCEGCGQTVLVARPGIFSGIQPSDWERLWAFRTRAGSLEGSDPWRSAPPLGQDPRGLSLLPLGKVLVASLASPRLWNGATAAHRPVVRSCQIPAQPAYLARAGSTFPLMLVTLDFRADRQLWRHQLVPQQP